MRPGEVVELYLTLHESFVSTSLFIIATCYIQAIAITWVDENAISSVIVALHTQISTNSDNSTKNSFYWVSNYPSIDYMTSLNDIA